MKYCTICGRWNEDNDAFCTGCGNKLAQDDAPAPQPSMEANTRTCPACGAANESSSRFCTTCGKPLDINADAAATQGKAVPLPAPVGEQPIASSPTVPMPAVPLPSAPSPSAAAGPSMQPAGFPMPPTAVPASPAGQNPDRTATVTGGKGRRLALIIIAIIVVIALVVSGVLVWQSRKSNGSQTQAGTSAQSAATKSGKKESATQKPKKSAAAKKSPSASPDTASRVLDKPVMDAIVDTYNSGSGNAAVSVMTSDNLKSYSSSKASYSMSAAGLYLPPWLAYYDLVGGSPAGGYQSVLSSMDNGKANELIDRDGGMDMLNSWLKAHDYDDTSFEHLYGDVNASEDGYDNTTSSDDAAKMLTQLMTKGEDGLLGYNIASDGVAVPDGATVHAHRGMGVGDAYDYYMVVSNGSKKVAVVVLTQGQTKEQAASLTSNVLKQVWQNMFVSGK